MTQRELTVEELQVVMETRSRVRQLIAFADTGIYWQLVLSNLNAMATHSTTDGKYYVDPGPPIPSGYRKAVAGDEIRSDCLYWSTGKNAWAPRAVYDTGFCRDDKYIVPIDCIPTDSDAKSRPVVMVLDCQTELWEPARLLAVIANSPAQLPFIAQIPDGWIREYRDCRFPYPGEHEDSRSLRLDE